MEMVSVQCFSHEETVVTPGERSVNDANSFCSFWLQ